MRRADLVMIDRDKILKEWFHHVTAWRAALYACDQYNRLVKYYQEGYTLYDNNGEFVPEMRVSYGPRYKDGPQFEVSIKAGENVWYWRIGDCRSARSGKVYLTKKEVNIWLSEIRFLNPKHLQRLRLR